ncbi:MAG: ribosome maturation factor [Balneola sp.]|nr:MAG: ribosome maturation factor [Balneola sp.]
MTPDVTETIKELASPLAEEKELFLVDVELKTGSGTEVWVYLDGEDKAVNIDECAEISRELGFLIDAHELLGDKYRLNVSSPGLSRPLTDRRQYKKNIERTLKVRYRTEDQEVEKVEGVISAVEDDEVVLSAGNIATRIPFESIIEAKIIPVIK